MGCIEPECQPSRLPGWRHRQAQRARQVDVMDQPLAPERIRSDALSMRMEVAEGTPAA